MGEVRNGDQKVRKYLFSEILYGRQAVFYEDFFFKNYLGRRGQKNSLKILSGAQSENLEPSLRAVLMGTKSCTKILIFSTRFSCENLAVEDFVTLLMGKKSC